MTRNSNDQRERRGNDQSGALPTLPSPEELQASLMNAIANDDSIEVAASIADVGVDAIAAGVDVSGVPIFGQLYGVWKAYGSIRDGLYLRKVARFLSGLEGASPKKRAEFIEILAKKGKSKEFGETILLLLEHVDDTTKPKIIGRIMTAAIHGKMTYEKAMRLAAIVNRCYSMDLDYIKNFKSGEQREMYPIAHALFAAGLLSNVGISGGTSDPLSGGVLYELNEYGRLLRDHGLN